jgi:hypothetical protein
MGLRPHRSGLEPTGLARRDFMHLAREHFRLGSDLALGAQCLQRAPAGAFAGGSRARILRSDEPLRPTADH